MAERVMMATEQGMGGGKSGLSRELHIETGTPDPQAAQDGDPVESSRERADRLDPVWRGFRAGNAGISLKIRGDARATVALVVLLCMATLAVVAVIGGGGDFLADFSATANEAR